MNQNPHITLDQWRTLMTVVEAGGYAQAAEQLHKSQSSVTYAVQKLESLLGIKVFELQGRRATLTPTGQLLYRRARALVEEAQDLERAALTFSAGWEAKINFAVDVLFPPGLLLACLNQFGEEHPRIRIEVVESVLNGVSEALQERKVELAIASQVPPGFLGVPIMLVRVAAVAAADHPLHQLGQPLTYSDLRAHRLVVVRDSGGKRDKLTVSLNVDRCWTVANLATAIDAVRHGYGYAWLPEEQISAELAAGVIKPLPLRDGQLFPIPLYLIKASNDAAGPGVQRLDEIIRTTVAARYGRPPHENGELIGVNTALPLTPF